MFRSIKITSVCWLTVRWWTILILLPAAGVAAGADPAQMPRTVQQESRLRERERLSAAFEKCVRERDSAAAIANLEKLLALQQDMLGETSIEAFQSIESLAKWHAIAGDFHAARRWGRRALEIQQQVRPETFWTIAAARRCTPPGSGTRS